MAELLSDTEVLATLRPREAVAWMKEAAVAAHRGELHAPARVHAAVGGGRLVFTCGHLDGSWYGYRAYDTFGLVAAEQVVVVHDGESGRVRAMAVGCELGPRRTGALGGAAADTLAAPGADVVGIVGAGTQAWTQLWALAAVRELAEVRVFARDAFHRDGFARRAREHLGVACTGVGSAREAVDGAGIVVCATPSRTPVVSADWLAPGAYVATLGPKDVDGSEVDPALLDAADVLVTDSRVQALDGDALLARDGRADRLVELGAVLDDDAPGRTDAGQLCVFASVGLAGTEPYLLARLVGLG